jgi:hypothetical protein
MHKLVSVFSRTSYYILGLFTLIALTIFVFIPIALPLLLLWGIAILTAKCKPSLGRPLSPQSVFFAVEDLYVKPGHTLTFAFGFDGKVSKSQVEGRYKEMMEKQFPELKQYLSRWMGFYFWAKDPNFSLDDHLSCCDDEVKTIEEWDRRRSAMVEKPFKEGKSLWEIVLYTNCSFKNSNGMKAACILRIHHSLVDGYSLLKVINSMTDDKNLFEGLPKPNVAKRILVGWTLFLLRLCIRGPIDVLRAIRDANGDKNDWRIQQERMQQVGYRAEREVPLSVVKEIGMKHNVRTTAVIFAALTGGIRKYMEVSGSKLQNGFTVLCILPLPSHPDHLTNHM